MRPNVIYFPATLVSNDSNMVQMARLNLHSEDGEAILSIGLLVCTFTLSCYRSATKAATGVISCRLRAYLQMVLE